MSFTFYEHKEIAEGAHALISPSRHILKPNYTKEQFDNYILACYSTRIGTSIHELAAKLINNKIKVNKAEASKMITLKLLDDGIPRNVFDADNYVDTFVPYVKDAIGFDMSAEKVLKYSRYAFGTTDAIRYNDSKHQLRIHDLKTGKMPASLDQLVAYAALFFLEYKIKVGDVSTEIRIYQNGEILSGFPTASDILPIMDQIVTLNAYFEKNYGEG
jgi:hypothetical protein